MAKRYFQLSEQQFKQLRQRAQQTRDVHELKRLQAVRLYGSGVDSPTNTATLTCAGRSLRRWSHRYQQHGLTGLQFLSQ